VITDEFKSERLEKEAKDRRTTFDEIQLEAGLPEGTGTDEGKSNSRGR
jgi:hypothetical protein